MPRAVDHVASALTALRMAQPVLSDAPMQRDSLAEAVTLVARVVRFLETHEVTEGESLERGHVRYAEALAHTLLDRLQAMQATSIPAPARSSVRMQSRPGAPAVADEECITARLAAG
jgi:hypothetical protein